MTPRPDPPSIDAHRSPAWWPDLPVWSLAFPAASVLALLASLPKLGAAGTAVAAVVLVGCVLAAVHHAEVVAHRIGEPFGTLVLALAVTVIETSLIVSLMLSDPAATTGLARDTVFAAIMIIVNGIVGLCLLLGGVRHGEQQFTLRGVSATLALLGAMAVLTLVLPNYVSSAPGPSFAPLQLVFVGAVSLVLYGAFVLVQTVRHQDYFLPEDDGPGCESHAAAAAAATAWTAFAVLVVALVSIVLLAKGLSPALEAAVAAAGLPAAVVGIVIAASSAGESPLATIGLTIPAVAGVSLLVGLPLAMGVDAKAMTLLALSLFTATLTLGTGRTTVLGGAVHLVVFAAYLFTVIVP